MSILSRALQGIVLDVPNDEYVKNTCKQAVDRIEELERQVKQLEHTVGVFTVCDG